MDHDSIAVPRDLLENRTFKRIRLSVSGDTTLPISRKFLRQFLKIASRHGIKTAYEELYPRDPSQPYEKGFSYDLQVASSLAAWAESQGWDAAGPALESLLGGGFVTRHNVYLEEE